MTLLLIASVGLLFHLLTTFSILGILTITGYRPAICCEKITLLTLLLGSIAVYLTVVTSVVLGYILTIATYSLT